MHFRFLTLRECANSLKFCLAFAYQRLFFRNSGEIWLVAERPDQARDNGYCFFRYLRQKHPELDAYYVIKNDAPDRSKLLPHGNLINYDSWKHYVLFCASKVHISAHDNMCVPNDMPLMKIIKRNRMGFKNVFLPHGVSYGISEFCLAKYGKFDLFICSGKAEYDNVLANYGYSPEEVAYTGFPRLDMWHERTVNPKQLVLMPTWRAYLAQDPNTVITETAYFKAYQSLLKSEALARFLADNDLHLVFYLHNDMRKYVDAFTTDCPNIEIVSRDEQYDIQELLKSAALLITDYSSVHFDFAYMDKPVIYYQFDREEFFERQYKKGDFDARTDGFGPVTETEAELLEHLRAAGAAGFRMTPEYHERMRAFYEIYDDRNCERVYDTIRQRFS